MVSEAHRRIRLLKKGYAKFALLDRGTADIDVDLLHQGYLRLFAPAVAIRLQRGGAKDRTQRLAVAGTDARG